MAGATESESMGSSIVESGAAEAEDAASGGVQSKARVTVDGPTRRDIEAFLYLEARLADESRYDEWEALVTDDMHYWLPFGPGDYEPGTRVSYINDNRARLGTRIRQLATGVHHAQDPPSSMRRVVSNIEILSTGDANSTGDAPDREYEVGANFVLYEHTLAATGHLRQWAGRTTYRLRQTPDGLRMAAKRVELVNSTSPLPNLPFII